jgi:hypothetical protein
VFVNKCSLQAKRFHAQINWAVFVLQSKIGHQITQLLAIFSANRFFPSGILGDKFLLIGIDAPLYKQKAGLPALHCSILKTMSPQHIVTVKEKTFPVDQEGAPIK